MPKAPILAHTHGIGPIDYSSMTKDDLPAVERLAAERNLLIMPGVFLAKDYLRPFEDVLRHYDAHRGRYPHILGFSVEGPLLGKVGGVPPRGIWSPQPEDWLFIARLGRIGLEHLVIGPDGGDLDDTFGGVTFRDIVDLFCAEGVRLALGHFRHTHPELSAARTSAVIEHVHRRCGPGADVVLTDHLYNDMPRNFKHAWRTPQERRRREAELAEVLSTPWQDSNLDELLGPVPACLLRAAKQERILPFLNFDGDHVDLEICRATLDYLGPEHIVGMTDDIEIPYLAGEPLQRRPGNGLWYRSDHIVAAGTGQIGRQRENLERIGYGNAFDTVFHDNPRRAVQALHPDARAA